MELWKKTKVTVRKPVRNLQCQKANGTKPSRRTAQSLVFEPSRRTAQSPVNEQLESLVNEQLESLEDEQLKA